MLAHTMQWSHSSPITKWIEAFHGVVTFRLTVTCYSHHLCTSYPLIADKIDTSREAEYVGLL